MLHAQWIIFIRSYYFVAVEYASFDYYNLLSLRIYSSPLNGGAGDRRQLLPTLLR
jgi:hypothetical protein